MNTLVLSRQLPSLAPYDQWLGESISGARLFTDAERASGYAGLGFQAIRAFKDYETSSLVELEAIRLHREWPIDRIVATSEADILRAGRLRTHLKLPGQSAESAFAFRNKLDMKRRLQGKLKLVRVQDFQEVNEGYDVIRFVESHGYPAIVKPVDGFGSLEATALRSENDLAKLLQKGIRHGLEVETFIAGDMYHVDGLVLDDTLTFCWPSKYVKDNLSFANGGFTASHMLAPGNPLTKRLQDAAAEILSVLPTPPSTTFHLELFHTAKDELFFCEIASRTGGVLVNPTLEMAFGANLTKMFVRAQAGLPVDTSAMSRAPKRLLGWGLLPPVEGVFLGGKGETFGAPWLCHFEWTMSKGKRSPGPHLAGDQAAGFIVEFEDEVSGAERLVAAWKWAESQALWGP